MSFLTAPKTFPGFKSPAQVRRRGLSRRGSTILLPTNWKATLRALNALCTLRRVGPNPPRADRSPPTRRQPRATAPWGPGNWARAAARLHSPRARAPVPRRAAVTHGCIGPCCTGLYCRGSRQAGKESNFERLGGAWTCTKRHSRPRSACNGHGGAVAGRSDVTGRRTQVAQQSPSRELPRIAPMTRKYSEGSREARIPRARARCGGAGDGGWPSWPGLGGLGPGLGQNSPRNAQLSL